MELKKLLKSKLSKAAAFTGLALMSLTSAAQTNVTIEPDDVWMGAVICFENNPEQTYLWFQTPWGVSDIKTEVNTTANKLTLYPNYNTYNPTDAYWANGTAGNKILQGLTYTETDALIGQSFTFSGTVESNTLTSAYTAQAFVKVMNADYTVTLLELTAPLDEGNFTIPVTATQEGAAHIQYGFSVRGINANPVTMEANGNVVVAAGTAQEPEEPADVVVTLDTTNPGQLLGYANWFQLDGTTYIGGNVYDVANLRTDVNTSNNTFVLYPNFFAYGDGSDPNWASGGLGTRVFEGNTYIEDNTLINQNVTFQGHCISNTLADGYTGIAFIKLLNASYALLGYITTPLVGDSDFSVTVDTASPQYAGTAHVQYGYSVTGRNANPTQEAALGNAVVTGTTASRPDYSKTPVIMYPNPASSVLNFSSEDAIETIEIYNIMGQKVVNAKPSQNTATVDVSGLMNGVYIVNTTVNGKQNSARFIKQ